MGSLMSGWSCKTHDPKKVKYMRNKSMTQADIDAYWKSNNKTQHSSSSYSLPTTPSPTTSTSSYSLLSDHDRDQIVERESKLVYKRSASMPVDMLSSGHLVSPSLISSDQTRRFLDDNVKKNNCWWMASRWAFLNESPVLISEPPQKTKQSYSYTSAQREATVG